MLSRNDQKEIKAALLQWLTGTMKDMQNNAATHSIFEQPWVVVRASYIDNNTMQFWVKHVAEKNRVGTCFTVKVSGE